MTVIREGEVFVGTTNLQKEFFPFAWGRATNEKILGVVFRRPRINEKDQKAEVNFLTSTPGPVRKLRRWSADFQLLEGEQDYDIGRKI
jgi:hypothetical protein